MIKVYLARGMSGRIKEEVVKEALADKVLLEAAGFTVLCPVTEEKVKPTKETLLASYEQMIQFWHRDKEMIREANLVFDMTPHLKSEGVAHELGYARYHLWKKVIRVYPINQLPNPASIAYFEDDYVTDSILDAIGEAYRTHGTLWKRLKWRLNLYKRCWLKAIVNRLKEWK